jgi:pyruvate dehydrogenase E1 component alpha subunit
MSLAPAKPAAKSSAKLSRAQEPASPMTMGGLFDRSQDGSRERDRLRMMMLIRRFEETTYREYTTPRQLPGGAREMKIGGFCHLYSGQEAIAVAIRALFDKEKDELINAYRCHGHSLALGMDPKVAMAEMFGKATGCARGKGGSMHMFDAEAGNHGGHGIVGAHLALAVGIAFSQWYKRTDGVTFCLFGDGAVNMGTHNEALNLASLYKLPVIWIIENNMVAMGTQVERHSAETDLAKRGLGYNMPTYNVDANDVDAMLELLSKCIDRGRRGEGPSYISANTFRFRGHSMSDPLKYRSREQAEAARERDPIVLYELKLREAGLVTEEQLKEMDAEVREIVKEAVRQADEDPHPELESRWEDVLAEKYPLEK